MSTKDIIINVSKEEFLNKGFNDASLRRIASKCCLTAPALYRHFKNKEEIFQTIIKPFIDYFNETTSLIEKKDNDFLDDGNISGMWKYEIEGNFHFNILFGEYKDLVKLIVRERKEWFKKFIIDYEFEATIKYLNRMKEKGYEIKKFNLISFRLLLNSYFEAYLNLIEMDLNKDELIAICNEINSFYTMGFHNLLGF